MQRACHFCGSQQEPLSAETYPFVGTRIYCTVCSHKRIVWVCGFFYAFQLLAGLAAMVWLQFDPLSKTAHVFANLLLFELFFSAAIIPHEIGHALVGTLLGFRSHLIVLGNGPTVATTKLGPFELEIKAVPGVGLTYGHWRNQSKWRLAGFILSGPLTNLIAAGVGMVWGASSEWWQINLEGPCSFAHFFVWSHLLTFVLSMVPYETGSSDRMLPSDGLPLIRLILPERKIPLWLRNFFHWCGAGFLWVCALIFVGLAIMILRQGNDAPKGLWGVTVVFCGLAVALGWLGWRARPFVENASIPPPDGWAHQVEALVQSENLDELTQLINASLERTDLSPGSKAWLLDQAASLVLYDRTPKLLSPAVSWARQAVGLAPDQQSIKGTLASLLIELEQEEEEAQKLLQELYDKSEMPIDRGISALYLAIIAWRSGEKEAAQNWSERAKYHYPMDWLVERLRQEGISER